MVEIKNYIINVRHICYIEKDEATLSLFLFYSFKNYIRFDFNTREEYIHNLIKLEGALNAL